MAPCKESRCCRVTVGEAAPHLHQTFPEHRLPSALSCFSPIDALWWDCKISPPFTDSALLSLGSTGSLAWSLFPRLWNPHFWFLSLLPVVRSAPCLPSLFLSSCGRFFFPPLLRLSLSPGKGSRLEGACHPSWKLVLAWQTAFLRRKMATFNLCSAGHLSKPGH